MDLPEALEKVHGQGIARLPGTSNELSKDAVQC